MKVPTSEPARSQELERLMNGRRKVMFDLYFTERLTYEQLAERTGLHTLRVRDLVMQYIDLKLRKNPDGTFRPSVAEHADTLRKARNQALE